MTKFELIKYLEPFDDTIEIKLMVDGDELYFTPEYQTINSFTTLDEAQILLCAD
jgi:hypothetical protein